MMKFTTRCFSVALNVLIVLAAVSSMQAAGTSRTVDARRILTASSTKNAAVQATAFSKPLHLQRAAAEALFADRPAELQLTNFPLPGLPDGTLTLHRTADVVDENSVIILGTKNGGRRVTMKPISSYAGTLNDNPETRVSLHYSADDLTGMIQMADGSRVVIGRDGDATPDYVSHAIYVEGSIEGGSLLKKFVCGADELPVTRESLERDVKYAQTEQVQNGYLKRMNIALEIKEDVDSTMKAHGLNDDQILAYIVKVWAAVSQVYEQELNATVYLSYIQKFTQDEPGPYTADGTEPGVLLGQLAGQWRLRQSPTRTLTHLMALIRPRGGSFVGGIAYGGGMEGSNLCNPTSNIGSYSVSTVYTTAPDVPGLPTRSNGFVWDVFVIAHEMGHNCGAAHTHSCKWSPPLDSCQTVDDNTDGCVTADKRRVVLGTIMSYCHLVNGSTTPLTFGPARVTTRLSNYIAASPCVFAPPGGTVRITYPRGSETWNGGQTVDILWVSEGVTNVKLEYSINDGASWTDIIASTPTGFKKYGWVVPNVATSNLLIRISDVEHPEVNNVSLAKFTINVPAVPTITLTNPVGGERIAKGKNYTIKWTKVNVGTVSVDFAPDGTTWTPIVSDVNAVNHVWAVPDIITSNARIRVRSAATESVQSVSGPFAIGAIRFDLLKPKTGDTLCQSFTNGFIWSADFVDEVKIRYSVDGSTPANAIVGIGVPVAPGMFIATSSTGIKNLPEGTVIQIHILDNSDSKEIAVMPGIIVADCDKPSAVAGEIVSESDLKIVSITPSPAYSNAVLALSTAKAMTFDVVAVDMAGNAIVLNRNVHVETDGVHHIDLPLQALTSGAYMVSVRASGVQVSAPLRIAR